MTNFTKATTKPGAVATDGVSRIYQAYSGCDMVAHINNVQVGTLQAVTISITREVVPIYTMGSADVKTFVKGKRGIAGTMTFSTFDRHALIYDVFKDHFNGAEGKSYGTATIASMLDNSVWGTGSVYGNAENVTPPANSGINETDATSGLNTMVKNKILRYSDEIPPFNITLTLVNETGSASYFTIEGVVLVNEGYGFTMDDLTSETAFTYVARRVSPLRSLTNFFYPS